MPQEIKVAELPDLVFKVRTPTDTQMMMIARGAARADRARQKEDLSATIFAVSDMLDIIDSLIVEDAAREEIVTRMSTGTLEVGDLMVAITEAQSTNGTAPAPKPRVRRGRAA